MAKKLPGKSVCLKVFFYVGKDRFNPDDYQNDCWAIGDLRSNGRHCPAVSSEGRGRFNSRVEAERGLQALIAEGVTNGEQLMALGADRYYQIIYRDLFW